MPSWPLSRGVALRPDTDQAELDDLRTRVNTLAMRFPLYPNLMETTR